MPPGARRTSAAAPPSKVLTLAARPSRSGCYAHHGAGWAQALCHCPSGILCRGHVGTFLCHTGRMRTHMRCTTRVVLHNSTAQLAVACMVVWCLHITSISSAHGQCAVPVPVQPASDLYMRLRVCLCSCACASVRVSLCTCASVLLCACAFAAVHVPVPLCLCLHCSVRPCCWHSCVHVSLHSSLLTPRARACARSLSLSLATPVWLYVCGTLCGCGCLCRSLPEPSSPSCAAA